MALKKKFTLNSPSDGGGARKIFGKSESTNVKNNFVLVELLIVQSITLLLCTLRNAARSILDSSTHSMSFASWFLFLLLYFDKK